MLKSLPKRLALILGLLSLLVPLSIATSGSASAFQPYSVSTSTSTAHTKAACTFSVSKFTAATPTSLATVSGRLVASIGPRYFLAGSALATVSVGCEIYGNSGPAYESGSSTRNGSSTAFNKAITIAFDPAGYQVCVYAGALQKGGNLEYNSNCS